MRIQESKEKDRRSRVRHALLRLQMNERAKTKATLLESLSQLRSKQEKREYMLLQRHLTKEWGVPSKYLPRVTFKKPNGKRGLCTLSSIQTALEEMVDNLNRGMITLQPPVTSKSLLESLQFRGEKFQAN